MNQLSKYADENKLPIMDQQTFETVTNDLGKEKFRELLAEYIAEKVDKLGRRTEAYLRVVKG